MGVSVPGQDAVSASSPAEASPVNGMRAAAGMVGTQPWRISLHIAAGLFALGETLKGSNNHPQRPGQELITLRKALANHLGHHRGLSAGNGILSRWGN